MKAELRTTISTPLDRFIKAPREAKKDPLPILKRERAKLIETTIRKAEKLDAVMTKKPIFELDPKVIKLARDQFSFIKQSEAKLNFVIEDGRQALLKSQKKYDLIIIDVFNGPQIPYHFLTKEAFELYQSHIKPDGVLAFHASNSVYNFVPLLSKTSQILGLSFYSNSFTPDKSEGPQKYYPNRWYFAGRNSALIKGLSQKAGALKTYNQVNKDLKIWRDDFFPLSSILF